MMQNPSGMKELEFYLQTIKPEAAYFFEAGGDRTMVFIVNMDRTDQMAVFAEPLFMMGAKVEFHPVMLLEDKESWREYEEVRCSPFLTAFRVHSCKGIRACCSMGIFDCQSQIHNACYGFHRIQFFLILFLLLSPAWLYLAGTWVNLKSKLN